MKANFNHIFTSLSVYLIVLTMVTCKSPETKVENQAPADQISTVFLNEVQIRNAGIEVAPVQEMLIGNKLQLKGITELRPYEKVSITSPGGGYIKSLPYMKGMFVTKGSTLVTVEDPYFIQLQEDYLKARFSVQYMEKEYKRQKSLLEERAISEKIVVAAESELIQKRVEKKSLEEKLLLLQLKPGSVSEENISASIVLKAPISGYISQINANVGMRVSPTEPILEIIDVKKPYLALKAFEKDIPHLKQGQQVLAYTNEDKETKLRAVVRYVGKEISHEGNADIICEFSQPVNLPSGMYINAEIETDMVRSSALPEASIVLFEGKTYVFAEIKKGTYEMIGVTQGITHDGLSEIKSALNTQRNYVTKGAYNLLMELKNTAE